jgi:hypothetical protein
MNLYRAIRRGTIFKVLSGREPFFWGARRPGVVELGTKFAQWAADESRLSPSTTVLSVGLGEDVSFELALIERYGCRVFGFDPTPASVQYLAKSVSNPRFKAYPVAVADYEGTMTFSLPPDSTADLVNASAVADYGRAADSGLALPCVTLEGALRLCAVSAVDILKLDIEGAEYAVLAQAMSKGWLDGVSQLLVEFHHFLPGLSVSQTRQCIASLQQAGFRIDWIGRTNHEYLFTRQRLAA